MEIFVCAILQMASEARSATEPPLRCGLGPECILGSYYNVRFRETTVIHRAYISVRTYTYTSMHE